MILRVIREAGNPCRCGYAPDECTCDELAARRKADLDAAFAEASAHWGESRILRVKTPPCAAAIDLETEEVRLF